MTATSESSSTGRLPRMILLDAVGTVIYPQPSVAQVYAEVGRRFGSQISESQIAKRFQSTFDKAFRRQPALGDAADSEAGERFERERWRSVVQSVLEDVPEAGGEPFELLWDHFARPHSWRVIDDAALLIEALQRWRIPFGIASNFDRRLYPIMEALCGIDERNVFVSSVLGAMKPEDEFYRRALRRLNLVADDVLMIGDDWTKDFDAARRAGLKACCVRRSVREQPRVSPRIDQPPSPIGSLSELIPWFQTRIPTGNTV